MVNKQEDRRNAFIAEEAKRAASEIGDLRRQGQFVCDIAYMEGAMIEAAKVFDRVNSKT
ncbi:hypothetical protein HFN89_02815 [Rhizobium laguerreae]|nr:hypothetical protein [Rhizobium laguerreae]